METTDILDDLANLEFNESEQEKLDNKFRPETQVDINEPFYIASRNASFVVQCISVILGFGACVELAEKFPEYKEIVFLSFVGVLAGWEYYKRRFLSKIQEIRIKNKYKKIKLSSTPYKIASFILVAGSMAIGYHGAEPVIKKLSQHSPLQNIEELREGFFQQISEVQEEYLSASLGGKIDTLSKGIRYKYGKKKGELKSAGSNLVADLVEVEKEHIEQKNKAVNDLRAEMVQAMDEAKANNKEIVSTHEGWCSSFGLYASLGNILCDILLIILLRWCFNHEDSKRILNRKKKELQESLQVKEKEQFQEPAKKKEVEVQAVKEQEAESNPIGFGKKEGSLTQKNGQPAVLVSITKGKNKGKLVAKTRTELENNINSQSNPLSPRTMHLKSLLEKFA
jgi:hypothetical protein